LTGTQQKMLIVEAKWNGKKIGLILYSLLLITLATVGYYPSQLTLVFVFNIYFTFFKNIINGSKIKFFKEKCCFLFDITSVQDSDRKYQFPCSIFKC
jgi:hypothetical protein